jgi:steroid 5-alpha reductase family enzyme
MWIAVAVAIESMALIGVVSVIVTKRTHGAFLAGFNVMALVMGLFVLHAGLTPRTGLVLAMVGVYLLHINWVLLAWSDQTAVSKLDRKSPTSQKILLPVVLANTAGWAYCLPLYFATVRTAPLGLTDGVAVGVYLVGTVFHFGGDLQKRRFKLMPGTQGKVLDTGFWSLSRHPNYFGDFLIYVSFAVIGGSPWGWIAPLVNLAQYAFDAIPKSERWAGERYGAEWTAYTARTKAFVPYML